MRRDAALGEMEIAWRLPKAHARPFRIITRLRLNSVFDRRGDLLNATLMATH